MNVATITNKFRITIPKKIRENMHLKIGQKFIFINKGNILHLVPQSNIKELRGVLAGISTDNFRDR